MSGPTQYSLIAKVSGFYDQFLKFSGYQKSVENFVRELPFKESDVFKVLDAGCGTGLYTLAILKQYPNSTVVAFDFNSGLTSRLKEKLEKSNLISRVQLFSADIGGHLVELKEEKFDLVLTAGVLEHVNLEEVVKNLSRFLKPSGYFANSPVKDNWLGKAITKMYSCRPYTRKRNLESFTNIGFVVEKAVVPWSFKEFHIFKKVF